MAGSNKMSDIYIHISSKLYLSNFHLLGFCLPPILFFFAYSSTFSSRMSFNSPGPGGRRDEGYHGSSNMNQRHGGGPMGRPQGGPGPMGGHMGGDRGRPGPPVKNYSTGGQQGNSMGPGERGSLLGDNPMRGPMGGPPTGGGILGNPLGPMGGPMGSMNGPPGLMGRPGGPMGGPPGGPLGGGGPFGGPPPGGNILGPPAPAGVGILGGPLGLPGLPTTGPMGGLLGPLGGPTLPLVGLAGPLGPQINPPMNGGQIGVPMGTPFGGPMGGPLGGPLGGPMGAPILPMGSQAGPIIGQGGVMGAAAAGQMGGPAGVQLGVAGGSKEMTPPVGEIPTKLFEWAGSVVKMQPVLRCGILRLTGVNQVLKEFSFAGQDLTILHLRQHSTASSRTQAAWVLLLLEAGWSPMQGLSRLDGR